MKLEKGMWLRHKTNLVSVTSVGPKKTKLQHFGDDYSFQRDTKMVEDGLETGYYTVITPDEPEFATCRLTYQKREAAYTAKLMRQYELRTIMVSHDDYFVTTEDGSIIGEHDDEQQEMGDGLARWWITPEDRAKVADAIGRLIRAEVESYAPDSCEIMSLEAVVDMKSQLVTLLLSKVKSVVAKSIAGSDLTKVEHLRIGKGGDE